MNINDAITKSIFNNIEVLNSKKCGCYFCLSIFDSKEIKNWADQGTTALCPKCKIDAVLPNITDMETLTLAHKKWFSV